MASRWAERILRGFRHHHEPWALVVVLLYIYPEYQFLSQLPEFVRNTAIAPIVVVYLTVEGFMLALAPQMKNKLYRDLFAVVVGVPAILYSVYAYSVATFQSIQANISSTNVLTSVFQNDSFLFLFVVELYAIGLLFPQGFSNLMAKNVDRRKPHTDPEAKPIDN